MIKEYIHEQPVFSGTEVFYISGTTKMEKRHKLISEFNKPQEHPKIMIMQSDVGNFGISLVGAAHGITYEQWWHEVYNNQLSGRFGRPGQLSPVVYMHMYMFHQLLFLG